MDAPTPARERRTMTPAVIASALFVAGCAVFAVTFVAARGGLQLPVRSTGSPVAVASIPPSAQPSAPEPTVPPGTIAPPSAAPTVAPTTAPTVAPTLAPTVPPTFAPPTLEPGDPLLVLPECPDHPGCFEYVIVRGDTLSGIISRYLLDIDILIALNPDLDDPSIIVVGQTLYVGRDPMARLDPCPDGQACVLYVVQRGDSVGEIADRYLTTSEAILASNPGMPRPIVAGQVIRLPRTV